MSQELNLGEAFRALQSEYGESFDASFEGGKEMMAGTLQDRLRISRAEAEQLVKGLIEAHSIRWTAGAATIPMEQTSGMFTPVTNPAKSGTWHL